MFLARRVLFALILSCLLSACENPLEFKSIKKAKAEIEEYKWQIALDEMALVIRHGAPDYIQAQMQTGKSKEGACASLLDLGLRLENGWKKFLEMDYNPLELFEGVETECASAIEKYQSKQK